MYRSILQSAFYEEEIKRSRFLGYAVPASTQKEAEGVIQEIKEQHKQATHHCFCYVIGEDGIIQKCSDDGEPQGTAGAPMLEIVKREKLTNLSVVVVRYYGGIKLGASGLIRAYAGACKNVIAQAKIVQMHRFVVFSIQIGYEWIGKWDYFLSQYTAKEIKRNYAKEVLISVHILDEQVPFFQHHLMELTGGNTVMVEQGFAEHAVADGMIINTARIK